MSGKPIKLAYAPLHAIGWMAEEKSFSPCIAVQASEDDEEDQVVVRLPADFRKLIFTEGKERLRQSNDVRTAK